MKTLVLAAFLLLQQLPAVFAQDNSGTVQGILREKGTRNPLAGVNIFVLPHKLKATTDDQGRFTIEAVPEGEFQWVVNFSGYIKLEQGDRFDKAQSSSVRELWLERTSYQVYETTVIGKQVKRDDTTRSLTIKKALEMPGTFGDPVKAVQNLPGVARTASAQIVIQGSEPRDTKYTIDNHEVPFVFHFGGLSSVFYPESLERIDYLSAGFGAEYSRALGGYVNVVTKAPRRDRWGGIAFMDFINAGGMAEGPVGEKGSLLIGGRYSYIGAVVKAFADRNPSKTAAITAAPKFSDLTLVYETPLNDQDTIKITSVASEDSLQLIAKESLNNDPALRGSFEAYSSFYRLIPQWTRKLDGARTLRTSLSFGTDHIRNQADDLYFKLTRNLLGVRGEWEERASERATQWIGFDNMYGRGNVAVNLSAPYSSGGVQNPVSSAEKRQIDIDDKESQIGVFWRAEWRPEESSFTWQPQLRADYFSRTKEYLPAPRFALRYNLDDYTFWRFATGLYYQVPEAQETSESFGNPDVKAPRNTHFALGFEKDFRAGSSDGYKLGVGAFWKEMDRLVTPSPALTTRNGALTAENYNNEGKGRATGLETQLTWDQNPISVMLNYTYSRSWRWNPIQGTVAARFDQTHNINLLASYKDEKWKYGSRLRYVTGNPFTPVTGGVFDADNDVYLPVRGALYSERNDPFFQLDLRFDRVYVYTTWIMSLYLDLQNVTNYKTPQGYMYTYNYSRREPISGIGFFPSFGIKGEF